MHEAADASDPLEPTLPEEQRLPENPTARHGDTPRGPRTLRLRIIVAALVVLLLGVVVLAVYLY